MRSLPLVVRFAVGLNCLVLMAAASTIGVRAATGAFADGYQLTAVFDHGAGLGLDTSSDVRLRGVTVGQVESIEASPRGQARVHLQLSPDVRLPRRVEVTVEPLSVFGPRDVELTVRGSLDQGPYATAGDELHRTRAGTEIAALVASATELLKAVDPTDIRVILGSLAAGMDGAGQDIRRGIDGTDQLVEVLHARRDDTRRLLADVRTVADRVADEGPTITAAGDRLRRSLPVISDHEPALARILDDLALTAGELAALLGPHRGTITRIVAGLSATVELLAHRLDVLLDLPGAFQDFFRLVAAAARLPVGDGSVQLVVDMLIGSNLCSSFQPCREVLPDAAQPLLDLEPVLDLIGDAEPAGQP